MIAVGGGFEPPTVQLAKKQNFGGQPQSTLEKTRPALLFVYPELTTPETGGHGCQFRHPTLF
jgi:hypothetical protein